MISQNKKKKKVSHYQINMADQLGEGKFGKVYGGVDKNTQQQVAVKIITKPNNSNNIQSFRQSIKKEIQIMKKLKSPNIVSCIDVEETKSSIYIFQQLINGGTITNYICTKPSKRLCQKQAIDALSQILNGMRVLIDSGVMHRDLKFENILVHHTKQNKTVFKVCDFGLSKYTTNTNSGKSICGSPAYMAPQLLESYGKKDVIYTFKCDIWSIGLIAYQLINGKDIYPWKLEPHVTSVLQLLPLIKQRCELGIQFIAKDNISENYKNFVKGCLQYQEKDRFDWNAVFHHPIFGEQFKDLNFVEEGYLMTALREKIHQKNINLTKLIAKLPQKFKYFLCQYSQQSFFYFLRLLSPQIHRKSSDYLFALISKKLKSDLLTREQILGSFKGYDIALECLTPKASSQEQKQRIYKMYQLFDKIGTAVYQSNIDLLFTIYKQHYKKGQNAKIDRAEFNAIMKNICKLLQENQLDELFKFFNQQNTARIYFQSFYEKLCKAAQFPTVTDESFVNQLKVIMKKQ